MSLQSNVQFGAVPPSAVPTPATGYHAVFKGDGNEGTAVDTLYKMDSSRTVTALIPAGYTDEQARDATQAMFVDSATVDFTTSDPGDTVTAAVVDASITLAKLADLTGPTAIGKASAGSGPPGALTPAQVTASLVNDATLPTGTGLPGRLTAIEKARLNRDRDLAADGAADATGATDCTTTFNNLLAAGGPITVGIGTFKVNTAAVSLAVGVDGTHIRGMSQRNSIIQPNHATQDCFSVTGDECVIENLRIQPLAASTRTGGYAINITSSADTVAVKDLDIIWTHSGVKSSGALHYVDNCNIREVSQNAPGGAGVFIENPGDRYVRRVTSDSGGSGTGAAGIRVKECSSLVVSDSNLIHAGTCLDLDPTSGKTIASVKGVNCFFDTSVNGLIVNGVAAAGSIYRSNFTACWFGSHSANGALLNGVAAGTAQFDGISFSHCEFYQNTTAGINCPLGGGAWTADACKIAQNGTGINLTPGTNHFPRIRGCEIGPYGNFGANTTGINIAAGTYKGLIIANCAVVNNTTNFTSGTVTVGATEAGWYRIIDNAGINPRGAVTPPIATPITATTYTNNTGFRCSVHMKAATWNGLAVNGIATFAMLANQAVVVTLEPGSTIALTGTTLVWQWIGM